MEEKAIAGVANVIGFLASFSGFAVMFVTFMMIYFGKWSGIDINYYGEANFEFVLLVILLPFFVYTTWQHAKTIARSIFGGKHQTFL